jgi:2,3-bisphosphoglycerate-independent phosphoglycerate mutase
LKYVVCVPDGCADEPVAELDGRTPLEAAAMPTLARLAARGEVGRAAVIPAGYPPGSDVGNMSILGFDPARYHTGRAPIEAAALGIELGPDEVAYRCNLVTIEDDAAGTPTMVDFAGGHPSSDDAASVIHALQEQLGASAAFGEVRFHPGVQYRHIVVAPKSWADASCTPPHDLSDKPIVLPTGPSAPKLQALMDASRDIVGPSALKANQIWLWGQGARPALPAFRDEYGVEAGLCTAVDLIRGLGRLTDMRVVEVEGATGWYDTSYENKRDACLRGLQDGLDLFLIHIEASDEAGHAGNLEEKVRSLESWDSRVLTPLVDALDAMGPWRLLLLPDHPTPVALKTHTMDPVPWLLVDSAVDGPGGVYSEPATAGATSVPGHSLMARLLQRA